MAAVLAACGVPTESGDGAQADETAPATDGTAGGVVEPCGRAPFTPVRLPWDEAAGEPDAVVDETDRGWGEGVTSMWWWRRPPPSEPDGAGTWPWNSGDDTGNRYVILQRGVDDDVLRARGVDVTEQPSSEGVVRGHPAALTTTGDPGVGGGSLHWAEGEGRCDNYMLVVQPWDTEAEMWSLAPE